LVSFPKRYRNVCPFVFDIATYQDDIKRLSFVTRKEHMKGNELMDNFNTSQFTVRMSRDTYTQLRSVMLS
jgi:hypothetical protein